MNGNLEPHLSEWNEYMESPWNEMDKSLGRKAIDKKGAWGYLLSIRGILSDAIKKGITQLQFLMMISFWPNLLTTIFLSLLK